MNFVIHQPGLAALILLVISSIITVALDFKRNNLTFPHLWEVLKRDKLTTAIMFAVAYSICFLCVSGVIAGLNLFHAFFPRA